MAAGKTEWSTKDKQAYGTIRAQLLRALRSLGPGEHSWEAIRRAHRREWREVTRDKYTLYKRDEVYKHDEIGDAYCPPASYYYSAMDEMRMEGLVEWYQPPGIRTVVDGCMYRLVASEFE
jgi:hypothetical protein